MLHRFFIWCFGATFVACGHAVSIGAIPGTNGGAGNGGSSAIGGNQNPGGTSSTGGAASDAGSPCTGTCPSGTVTICEGAACPFEECDDDLNRASTRCSSVYPAPLNSATTYCNATRNGSYCLTTADVSATIWIVTCVEGTPTLEPCAGGCSVTGFSASC